MSHKSIAMKYFDNATKNPEVALACFAGGAEFLSPMGALPVPEGVRGFLDGYKKSFPDSGFEITRIVEQGDQIAVEGFWVGTHTGPMQMPDGTTVPPTNRKVRAPFATFLTIVEGKIKSHRGYWDLAGFMMQLGLTK